MAATYPWEAMNSVLFPLLTLETPGRWVQLEKDNITDWVESNIGLLPEDKQQLFAADCVEQVLPFFESKYPGDFRPRLATRARRLFALGKMTSEGWKEAQASALAASREVTAKSNEGDLTCGPAAWVARAAKAPEAVNVSRACGWAQRSLQVVYESRRWQWDRLMQYLRGETP